MPAAADPTPAIAYGLYSEEPIHAPGGALIMPDLPPEARTRQARLARLKESSSWAEIILLDWFKRLAVFGVSAGFDIDRFERATQSLWRLTAIAKSIEALENNPNAPISPALQSEVDSIMDHTLGARASTPAEPTSTQPATRIEEITGSADAPVRNPLTSTNPATDSTHSPVTHPASSATPSPTANPGPALQEAPIPSTPPPTTSTSSDAPRAALVTPHLSPAPAVRAVPACPTLSLDAAAAYLTRTEADLAEATRAQSSAGFQPASSPSPSSKGEGPVGLRDRNSKSEIRNPQSSPPCPSGSGQCIQCAVPHCAARQAVPFHHKPRVLKCDGTCRECAKTRACPFTPAYLRPG